MGYLPRIPVSRPDDLICLPISTYGETGMEKETAMSDSASRIALDPAILSGKPVVRGTRLAVDFIIGLLADGWTDGDIIEN